MSGCDRLAMWHDIGIDHTSNAFWWGRRAMPAYYSREGVTSRLRKRGHDYASAASYFITICIEERAPLLGEITDGSMCLSAAGAMVDSW